MANDDRNNIANCLSHTFTNTRSFFSSILTVKNTIKNTPKKLRIKITKQKTVLSEIYFHVSQTPGAKLYLLQM